MEVRDIEKLAKEWRTIRKKERSIEKRYLNELKSLCKEKYEGKVVRIGDTREYKIKKVCSVEGSPFNDNLKILITGESLLKYNYFKIPKKYGRYQETFLYITDIGDLLYKEATTVGEDIETFDKEYEYWKHEPMKSRHRN